MATYRPEQFINFEGLQQFQKELGRLVEGDWASEMMRNVCHSSATDGQWVPAMDLVELDDLYQVRLDLPGVSLDAVNVSVHRGELTIKGQRTLQQDADKIIGRAERSGGDFERRLDLPEGVDENSIEASMSDGVLTIKVVKATDGATARSIKINTQ